MANFHQNFMYGFAIIGQKEPELAQVIQDILGLTSVIEYQYYPVNAKYHMQLEGINMQLKSRVKMKWNLPFLRNWKLNS